MSKLKPTYDKEALFLQIKAVLDEARSKISRTVNSAMVQAYWNVGKYIVEHEQKQAQQQKWQRLQEFLQHSPRTVDRLERDAISRSFDKGQQAGDEELAEFIKYHRMHIQSMLSISFCG